MIKLITVNADDGFAAKFGKFQTYTFNGLSRRAAFIPFAGKKSQLHQQDYYNA
jgi:peptidase E